MHTRSGKKFYSQVFTYLLSHRRKTYSLWSELHCVPDKRCHSVFHHNLHNCEVVTSCMAVQHRVNGDHAFLWETAKFDLSQNQNPLTACYEIVNIWLRPGDMPPCQLL